jgi:hypothetical protein
VPGTNEKTVPTHPTKVAGTLHRAVRSWRFAGILGAGILGAGILGAGILGAGILGAGILGGRHMQCAYYF